MALSVPVAVAACFVRHSARDGGVPTELVFLDFDLTGGDPPISDESVVNPAGLPPGTYRVVLWDNPGGAAQAEAIVGTDDAPGMDLHVLVAGPGGVGGTGAALTGGGGGGGGGLIVVSGMPAPTGVTFTSAEADELRWGSGGGNIASGANGGDGGTGLAAAVAGLTTFSGSGALIRLRYPAGGGGSGGDGGVKAGGAPEAGGNPGGAITGASTAGGSGGQSGFGSIGSDAVGIDGGAADQGVPVPLVTSAIGVAILAMFEASSGFTLPSGAGGGGSAPTGDGGVGGTGGGDGGTDGGSAAQDGGGGSGQEGGGGGGGANGESGAAGSPGRIGIAYRTA